MNILILDAQGGGIGRALIAALLVPTAVISAAGTAAMLKAGAHHAATGENAAVVGCRTADVIAGPIGIVIADSLFGEVTPAMAAAVGQSRAKRVLIPVNQCGNLVAGVRDRSISVLVQEAVQMIRDTCG